MSKELAADYFSRHESSNECHVTSDGRVFHTKGAADSFANGLKDNKVESFSRASSDKNDTDEPTDEAASGFTPEEVKAFDTTVASYAEIKALANGLGLDPASQKKEDLSQAIEAYKAALNIEIKE